MQAQWQAGDSWGEDGAEGELGTLGKTLKEWDDTELETYHLKPFLFMNLNGFPVIFISQVLDHWKALELHYSTE